MNRMRVAVYEPDHRGHHYAYLAHVLPAISELVDHVTLVTTPTGANSPQFQLHLSKYADRFQVDASIDERESVGKLRYSVRGFQQIRDLASRLTPDHLYVPYGDGLAQAIGLARLSGQRAWSQKTEAEVLLMRGGYRYPAENIRRRCTNFVGPRAVTAGPWTRIHHLNPDDLAVLKRLSGERDKYRLMPDPVQPPPTENKSELRRQLGIPTTGRYVGCAGGIDRRKGIHLLVRAFVAIRGSLRADDRLLLAGPMDETVRTIVANEASEALAEGRIVVIDRPLSATEVVAALAAMDLVATPYPAHPHSASIVIQAAACGRPVLGSSIGWMLRTIRDFGLGATCNVCDHDELCTSLSSSLDASETFRPSEAAHRFVAFHGVENFRAHWLSRLRERRNLPKDPNLISWESVAAGLGSQAGIS
jgi:glycosyltransferase involved in cell wall biosynthesis